jgi:hypothetical protein
MRLLQRVVERFALTVCPPQVRDAQRLEGVLREFGLMTGALQPAARRALLAAFVAIDQGARLYPRSRGRRLVRLGDDAADAYLTALLARFGLAERLKGVVVMCYYELAEVKQEIGYDPDPYIAAVSRRRLQTYGAEIAAAEAAQAAAGSQAAPRSAAVEP